ncbi:MAG: hypothetical protein H6R17_4024 [Proteobacteria bacterium]|nr:hypothetical protein [Pseudomonadota bacterium]
MAVQHERRVAKDRRAFAVYYRYGNERRNNTGNRRLETVEELRPYFARRIARGDAEATERAAEIIKEIAEAFGVQPDSLTLVENDDLVDSAEICQPCEDRARRTGELEAELAERPPGIE